MKCIATAAAAVAAAAAAAPAAAATAAAAAAAAAALLACWRAGLLAAACCLLAASAACCLLPLRPITFSNCLSHTQAVSHNFTNYALRQLGSRIAYHTHKLHHTTLQMMHIELCPTGKTLLLTWVRLQRYYSMKTKRTKL